MKPLLTAAVLASLASPAAYAQTNFGDWFVGRDSDGTPHVATVNDSDAIFGKWCDGEAEKCFWMFGTQTSCEAGASIPALVSAPKGAQAVNLICAGPKQIAKVTIHRFVIQEFDLMTKVVREGGDRVGIVIATESGAFRVSRFSLSGGPKALARMEEAESEFLRVKQRRTTRDRVL